MSETSRRKLSGAMTRRSFDPGGVVFWEDDPGELLYVVESGHVLVEHAAADGVPVPFTVIGPDEIIGEDGLIDGFDRLSTARAITEVTLLSLSRAAYNDLGTGFPEIGDIAVKALAARNRQLYDALLETRHRAPEERLRKQLQQLGRMFGDEIPLTQATIAGLAGTSKAAAKGVLSALQGNGTIEITNGRIRIITGAGLA